MIRYIAITAIVANLSVILFAASADAETPKERDQRMAWFREARFGMFIHWGLYSVPAGEWKGDTKHAEWIRTTAQIPLAEYDKFREQFNPVKFDADAWVKIAKDAGCKYIVITSKHHDGFCLFDSKQTDFDIMSTPFKRDIMKELAEACRKAGLKMCWYHSIMDWHHPDYLPRRDWEKDRPTNGADFKRFNQYLQSQVTELLTNYGDIGIMWFDGEWEGTWTNAFGGPLYELCRKLQPKVIVNNRVDKGRGGMAGMTTKDEFAGDYGTPEQEIPPRGLPGIDWESCMTMNNNWGFNKHDHNWKSPTQLIRMLVETSSKGGNLLLNIGPLASGEFPPEAIERMAAIGKWMKVNSDAIYGSAASPFGSLPWGRCTQRILPSGDTMLYLHVFEWPKDGSLSVPGIFNEAAGAHALADSGKKQLPVKRHEDALVIDVRGCTVDPLDTVIALHVKGRPDIDDPPEIRAEPNILVDKIDVPITSPRANVEIRYTTDGTPPSISSAIVKGPVTLTTGGTLSARCFRSGRPVSGVSKATFTKVAIPKPVAADDAKPGLHFDYYEGSWDKVPDFDKLKPIKSGVVEQFDISSRTKPEFIGFKFDGFVTAPAPGVYQFWVESDDGSRLTINDTTIENDGLHTYEERSGFVALSAGKHRIRALFFQKEGGIGFAVKWAGPGVAKQPIPASVLSHK